jgi:capsule biosynthesis phosphatase
MASAATPLTVMIPLGGIGSRFQKEGYVKPKPFVSVLGKPMILWVIDSLKLGPQDALVIVYNPAWMSPKYWEAVTALYPRLQLVELPGATRGAAETVLIGLQGLSKALRDQPVMLVDGDCFYEEDIVATYRAIAPSSNGVFYFVDTQPKPIYSYIVFEPSTRRIGQVKEKVKISDHANTGCYCFSKGSELLSQCQALLDAGATQTGNLSTHTVGEYYTSGVIAQMIAEGATFTALQIDPTRMHVIGTPTQLVEHCTRAPSSAMPAQRICFDLDHTLLAAPPKAGDYLSCAPIAENVAALKALFAQGHTIILHTERQMDLHNGNAGAATADCAAVTVQSLQRHGIPYHELYFGKPHADFYVDDKAVSSLDDPHKEVGFYPNSKGKATPHPSAAPAARLGAGGQAGGGGGGGGEAGGGGGASWPQLLAAALVGAGVASVLMGASGGKLKWK